MRTQTRDELLALGRRIDGVQVSDASALTAASPARALQGLTERRDVAAIVVGSTARERRRRILAGKRRPAARERSRLPGRGCAPRLRRRASGSAADHAAAVVAHGGEGVFVAGEGTQVLAEHSADLGLLVTGSRGYGPLGAVLVGSTTQELLRSAACPLPILPRGRDLFPTS